MNRFNNIYKDKTVLVTGHTGFKGSWLSLWLKHLGANVVGYSLDPEIKPSLFEILKLNDDMVDIHANILDIDKLKKTLKKYQPEIIFHLAAQAIVKTSYEIPKLTFQTNTIGVINLFEAIRECGTVKALVNVTTDKVYADKEWDYGYRENDTLCGFDPYSASKACSEIITSSYRDSFFNIKEFNNTHNLLIATARAGNVIGGGDWGKHRLIPDCIKAIIANETIEIRNPESIRPWQLVLEPLSGYLLLGQMLYEGKKDFAGSWNFGPLNENVVTVEEVTKRIIKIWKSGKYTIKKNNTLHETTLLKLDISKATSQLKWKPMYLFDETIKQVIDWHKEYNEGQNMRAFSLQQIEAYTKKVRERELFEKFNEN